LHDPGNWRLGLGLGLGLGLPMNGQRQHGKSHCATPKDNPK
jgi:hypothetical protein